MPRYIDADALLKAMNTWDKFGFSHSGAFVREPKNKDYVPYVHYADMVKCVEGIPTADVVEVVRCKDCKHNSLKRMTGNAFCELGIGLSQIYDFCSHGERREDDAGK